jgi:hypothetical protein
MERVYVETSIVSYLTARPSRDLIVAGHQQLTHEWWSQERPRYELCASPLVVREASSGDPAMVQLRLEKLRDMPLLEITDEALALAERLVRGGPLPPKAQADALHIALAAVHGVEYLLTWNCTHIANARLRPRVEAICRAAGYVPPVLCTPEELSGGSDVEGSDR